MSRRISFTPSLENARFLDKLVQEAAERLGRSIGVGEVINAVLQTKREEVERLSPTPTAAQLSGEPIEIGLPEDLRAATLVALGKLH